jgi:hypothetical protein
MAFINERISEEDLENYQIAEIDSRNHKANFESEWTRDREKDIYLRWMSFEREPFYDNFCFYWNGTLLDIRLKRQEIGVRGGKGSTTWSMYPWGGHKTFWLPETIEKSREEIVKDLKEALTIFKDFGLGSTISEHTVIFEF